MEIEKIREVIETYRAKFKELGAHAIPRSPDKPFASRKDEFDHCYYMLNKMEEFCKEGDAIRAARWLGFIQGVLWTQKVYTITELREQNRSDGLNLGQVLKKTNEASTQDNTRPAGNISQCLTRMTTDSVEISKRLIEAPLSLIGTEEPKLWGILQRIRIDLEEARKIWLT